MNWNVHENNKEKSWNSLNAQTVQAVFRRKRKARNQWRRRPLRHDLLFGRDRFDVGVHDENRLITSRPLMETWFYPRSACTGGAIFRWLIHRIPWGSRSVIGRRRSRCVQVVLLKRTSRRNVQNLSGKEEKSWMISVFNQSIDRTVDWLIDLPLDLSPLDNYSWRFKLTEISEEVSCLFHAYSITSPPTHATAKNRQSASIATHWISNCPSRVMEDTAFTGLAADDGSALELAVGGATIAGGSAVGASFFGRSKILPIFIRSRCCKVAKNTWFFISFIFKPQP